MTDSTMRRWLAWSVSLTPLALVCSFSLMYRRLTPGGMNGMLELVILVSAFVSGWFTKAWLADYCERHPVPQERFPSQRETLDAIARTFEERTGRPAEPIPGGYRMVDDEGGGMTIQGFSEQ